MLRNLFTALTLSLISMVAFAGTNGYCEGRPTLAEKRACYSASQQNWDETAQLAVSRMQVNIDALKKANLPGTTQFLAEIDRGREAIDRTCKDNECVARSVGNLNNKMAAWYRQNKK